MKPIQARCLRELTLNTRDRSKKAAYLSAASGLVCAYGKVYVVSDDGHHLAVFSDALSPGKLFRIFFGNLPENSAERKALKPDIESLFLLPALGPKSADALIALGSGSKANRCRGVRMELNSSGEPSSKVSQFSLLPIYEKLTGMRIEIQTAYFETRCPGFRVAQ
jgi:hypothetical protein